MKKILLAVFLLSSFLLNSVPIKDTFNFILIKKNKYVNCYENPDLDSEIIIRIPADTNNLRTTWKTYNKKGDSWIQIKYKNEIGWIKRNQVTRYYGEFNKDDHDKIINLLLKLTKALQQEKYDYFKECFHSLRGLVICDNIIRNISFFEYKEYKTLWQNINNGNNISNRNINKNISNMLRIFESDFIINYNIDEENIKNIPFEIKNFQYVRLYSNNDSSINDIKLYLGIEFWNNMPFISCIYLEY